jgi:hypothetical protein
VRVLYVYSQFSEDSNSSYSLLARFVSYVLCSFTPEPVPNEHPK